MKAENCSTILLIELTTVTLESQGLTDIGKFCGLLTISVKILKRTSLSILNVTVHILKLSCREKVRLISIYTFVILNKQRPSIHRELSVWKHKIHTTNTEKMRRPCTEYAELWQNNQILYIEQKIWTTMACVKQVHLTAAMWDVSSLKTQEPPGKSAESHTKGIREHLLGKTSQLWKSKKMLLIFTDTLCCERCSCEKLLIICLCYIHQLSSASE